MNTVTFQHNGKSYTVDLDERHKTWAHHNFKVENPAIPVLKAAFPWAVMTGGSCWGSRVCWEDKDYHTKEWPCSCTHGEVVAFYGPSRRQIAAVLLANGFPARDAKRLFG